MRISKEWVEMTGTTAVVIGLIFVGMELRQNTISISAATYDRLAENSVKYLYQISDNAEMAELMSRAYDGEPRKNFTRTENTRIIAVEIALLMHLQNSFRQYQAGVVSEQVFSSYAWKDSLLWTPHFREAWPDGFDNFVNEDFVNFLSEHIKKYGEKT